MFHRRHFLKTTATALAALILPRSLFARTPDPHFHFIHADTLNSWAVADPVAWALANQHEPILERASTGLAKLTASDEERIVRLVVRRCRSNLLELRPDQVVVQHWGQQGLADLRPFFKQQRLARPEIEVVLRDRKREMATTKTGDSFLYGDRIAPDFPLELFQTKWGRRFERDADDWSAAPGTSSGFAWEGVEDNRIPWAALKSAWRQTASVVCMNCDTPTILVNFGLRPVGMFNRSPHFFRVCGTCRRSFVDDSITDVRAWIERNLDAEVRPGFEMVWGRRVAMQTIPAY